MFFDYYKIFKIPILKVIRIENWEDICLKVKHFETEFVMTLWIDTCFRVIRPVTLKPGLGCQQKTYDMRTTVFLNISVSSECWMLASFCILTKVTYHKLNFTNNTAFTMSFHVRSHLKQKSIGGVLREFTLLKTKRLVCPANKWSQLPICPVCFLKVYS